MNTIKCLKVNDVFFFKLPPGIYLIDEKVHTVRYNDGEIQAASNKIIPISSTSIPTHYENAEGNELSIDQYESKLADVISRGIDDNNYDYTFESDEDALLYIKLKRRWFMCSREVVQYGDTIPIESKPVVTDTGSDFVKPILSLKEHKLGLYRYDRAANTMNAMTSTFSNLEMQYVKKIDHAGTKSKKVWGRSNHSHLKYVTAFGGYVFNKEYSGGKIGTLENMLALCKLDHEEIRRIIRSKYAAHFNGADLLLEDLMRSLRLLLSMAGDVESMKKTHREHARLKQSIRKLIESCEDALSEQA